MSVPPWAAARGPFLGHFRFQSRRRQTRSLITRQFVRHSRWSRKSETPGRRARTSGETRAERFYQVVRLLTAGARIDELSLGDVLELLRLRGDRREGLSRATYYRWIRRADRGDLSARDLEEWLKIHEPYALGTARLTQLASVEDSYELPMRLWVGVAPSSFDVVLAELKVLRAAHLRGGRPDAAVRAGEFMAFVEEMSSGGRTISTSRFPSFAGFLTSRASDSTKVFDGVRIAVNGVEASVQTASYRAVTEAYSSALDGEAGEPFTPSWALRQLRDADHLRSRESHRHRRRTSRDHRARIAHTRDVRRQARACCDIAIASRDVAAPGLPRGLQRPARRSGIVMVSVPLGGLVSPGPCLG